MIWRRFKNVRAFGGYPLGLILILGLAAFLIFSFPNTLGAAEYPIKPVQVIVAFPPGGGSDIIARIFVDKLSPFLGQSVVVVNRAGGGGVIGTYAVLAAAPDGHTLLVISPSIVAAPLVRKGITFDFMKDFIPVNLSVTSPSVIVVRKEATWLTLKELIAEAKQNPGKLTYSTPGYGATQHFAGELFKMHTGVDVTNVPMDGTAPAVTAVLGGHISMTPSEYGVVYKYLAAGSLRALAVMSKSRLKEFADVPTTVEAGYPNLVSASYGGFAVRSDTRREIVEKLEKAFKEVLKDKEIIEKLEKTGWVVENLASKEGAEFLFSDIKMKSEVASTAKIVPK